VHLIEAGQKFARGFRHVGALARFQLAQVGHADLFAAFLLNQARNFAFGERTVQAAQAAFQCSEEFEFFCKFHSC